jgi:hypothetical protein
MAEARARGKVRIERRDYVMADGDVDLRPPPLGDPA